MTAPTGHFLCFPSFFFPPHSQGLLRAVCIDYLIAIFEFDMFFGFVGKFRNFRVHPLLSGTTAATTKFGGAEHHQHTRSKASGSQQNRFPIAATDTNFSPRVKHLKILIHPTTTADTTTEHGVALTRRRRRLLRRLLAERERPCSSAATRTQKEGERENSRLLAIPGAIFDPVGSWAAISCTFPYTFATISGFLHTFFSEVFPNPTKPF